jgi:alpha-D-ribose 1-methylphosphonate 5-triphosphate synthase subunit PhnG
MSIQDERELRDRLSGLLAGVEPGLPPVVRTMRRGRGIRMRKWVAAAAGLAVIAAGAALVPVLIQPHQAAPAAPAHYKVTLTRLGATARAGVIGAGTIDGRHWHVVLSKSLGDGCTTNLYMLACGPGYGAAVGRRVVSLGSAGAGGTQFEIGTIGADVTRVVVQLSNGTQLDVRPVAADGYRWIAFAAPAHAMLQATSFVGGSEYLHAVAYATANDTEFVTWLRPGQLGLPRATRQIGSGEVDGVSWHASVNVGPWGYCVAFANGGSCIPTTDRPQLPSAGQVIASLSCGPVYTSGGKATGASAGIMAVPLGVKNVVLRFADGSHLRMTTTPVAGTRVLGYAIQNRPKVVRTLEYGFAGQLVHSTSQAGWVC